MADVQTKIGVLPEVVGADRAASEIAKIYRSLRAGTIDVKTANAEMRNYSGTIYAQRRSVSLLRTEWRNTHATMLEGLRAMQSVARIGRTITDIYQTYTLAQIRIADKTRDVRDTEEELAKVQEMRRQIVQDLGAENVYALRFMDEEERLTKRLTEEKRDLSQAQRENIVGYVGMTLQALDVVSTSVDLVYHFSLVKNLIGDKGFKATALETISTTAIAAKTEVAALQTSLSGLSTIGAIAIPVAITLAIAYEFTKKPEEIRQDIVDYIIGTEGRGPGGAPDWGLTMEQLMGDLPPGSPLMDVYTGAPNVNITVEGKDVDVGVDVDVSVTTKSGGKKNKFGGSNDGGTSGGGGGGGGGGRRGR